MQIIPFSTHYQLVCTNFDFSSFSRISCSATVALSHPNCGSFASPEGPNENVSKFFQWFKAYFSFWLESSGGGDFVNIILHVLTLAELTIPVSIQTEGEMIERGYAVTRYCCHYHMYQSGEHE